MKYYLEEVKVTYATRGRLKKEEDEPKYHKDDSPGDSTGHRHGLYRRYMGER